MTLLENCTLYIDYETDYVYCLYILTFLTDYSYCLYLHTALTNYINYRTDLTGKEKSKLLRVKLVGDGLTNWLYLHTVITIYTYGPNLLTNYTY